MYSLGADTRACICPCFLLFFVHIAVSELVYHKIRYSIFYKFIE